MPGIAKDKIEVKVEERDVTIGVEFREEVEANGKALWKERSYGKASRAIRLPEAVDANAALAKHVDGILQLTLPDGARLSSMLRLSSASTFGMIGSGVPSAVSRTTCR